MSKPTPDSIRLDASPAKISREAPAAAAADASRGPSAAMSKLRVVLLQGAARRHMPPSLLLSHSPSFAFQARFCSNSCTSTLDSSHHLQQPDIVLGGKLKADFVSQVEALDVSRTGADFPPISQRFPAHFLSRGCRSPPPRLRVVQRAQACGQTARRRAEREGHRGADGAGGGRCACPAAAVALLTALCRRVAFTRMCACAHRLRVPAQFAMTHDKLEGINFKRLCSSLSSADWKTWEQARVIAWLSDIFNTRDEKDRSVLVWVSCVSLASPISSPPPSFLSLVYRSLMERVSRAFKSNDIDGRVLAHLTKVTLHTPLPSPQSLYSLCFATSGRRSAGARLIRRRPRLLGVQVPNPTQPQNPKPPPKHLTSHRQNHAGGTSSARPGPPVAVGRGRRLAMARVSLRRLQDTRCLFKAQHQRQAASAHP